MAKKKKDKHIGHNAFVKHTYIKGGDEIKFEVYGNFDTSNLLRATGIQFASLKNSTTVVHHEVFLFSNVNTHLATIAKVNKSEKMDFDIDEVPLEESELVDCEVLYVTPAGVVVYAKTFKFKEKFSVLALDNLTSEKRVFNFRLYDLNNCTATLLPSGEQDTGLEFSVHVDTSKVIARMVPIDPSQPFSFHYDAQDTTDGSIITNVRY